MAFDYCQQCKTFDGIIARHNPYTGRALKPSRCANHTDAFYVCDLCAVRVAMQHGRDWRGNVTHAPIGMAEFEYLPTGELKVEISDAHLQANRRAPQPVKVHVCPECAASVREAMRVAFDAAVAKRQGLRAGVTLGL